MPAEHDVPALARLPTEVLLLIAHYGGSFAKTLVPLSQVSVACRLSITPVALPFVVVRCDLRELAQRSPLFLNGVRYLRLSKHSSSHINELPELPSLLSVRISDVGWTTFRPFLRMLLKCAPKLDGVDVVACSGSTYNVKKDDDEPWYPQREAGDTVELDMSRPSSFVLSSVLKTYCFKGPEWSYFLGSLALLGSVRRLALHLSTEYWYPGPGQLDHCSNFSSDDPPCRFRFLADALSKLKSLEELDIYGYSGPFYPRRNKPSCLMEHLCHAKLDKLASLRGPFALDEDDLSTLAKQLDRIYEGGLPKLRQLVFVVAGEKSDATIGAYQGVSRLPLWARTIFKNMADLEEIRLESPEPESCRPPRELALPGVPSRLVLKSPSLFPGSVPILTQHADLDTAHSFLGW